MDEEKLNHEVEMIQEKMANCDIDDPKYAEYIKKLKEIEELRRYSNHEDPETLKVEVEKTKVETEESEGKKNRRSGLVLKIIGAAGIGGLMCLSHFLQASQIMEKADEKFIDKYSRDKW